MRVLALHGVGHADARLDWREEWQSALTRGLAAWTFSPALDFVFPEYDSLFEAHDLHAPDVVEAFCRLTTSGLFHGVADIFRSRRGLGDSLESVRWTAGMVAQWTANEALRASLRSHLARQIRDFAPDVILAHSLGSLIAYDTLRRDEIANPRASLIRGRTLVTFGSQLGNPAVRAVLGGRLEALQGSRFWWHLFNERDHVFTSPLALPSPERFRRVDTHFDVPGFANHDGIAYLQHAETGRCVWSDLASLGASGAARGAARKTLASATRARRAAEAAKPSQRALLIGIADYPNPADRLEGPVNDVFRMSATLQELGFPADNIRVVLNDRATAAGIRERLRWLLADAKPGDTMLLHFAGHGAQVPGYGRDAEVDRIDECLVPYDFDWSQGTAISDDEFCGLYSQLPYESRFIALLDCCHSGGLARAGGSRARGLSPPDDVRHRMLRWDRELHVWAPRERFAKRDEPRPERRTKRAADSSEWLGKSGSMRRLGRATSLWMDSAAKFEATRSANGHRGPYAPILFEACAEGESAYEYRDGVTSHGAFSYAVSELLRDAVRRRRPARPKLTFERLLAEARERVRRVVQDPQHPQLVCPKSRRSEQIPGL